MDDSDTESTHDLSESSDNNVPINQVWHKIRSKERATVIFTVFYPSLNCIVALHISTDSS
jgi:hypothetical protein